MFKPGEGGRPKGAKNKKRVIRVHEFVAENNINIPQMWLDAILSILDPEAKAKALSEYNKWVAAMPKAEADDNEVVEENTPADVLAIIK